MPKRKEPPLHPQDQFKRFIETVREHEVDETGRNFERAFKKAVPPKRPKRKAQKAE